MSFYSSIDLQGFMASKAYHSSNASWMFDFSTIHLTLWQKSKPSGNVYKAFIFKIDKQENVKEMSSKKIEPSFFTQ